MPIINVLLFTDPQKNLLGANYDVLEKAGEQYAMLRIYRTEESQRLFHHYQIAEQATFVFPDGNKHVFALADIDPNYYLFSPLALVQQSWLFNG